MAARRGAVWIRSGAASDTNPGFDRVSIRPRPNIGDVRVHQLLELVNRVIRRLDEVALAAEYFVL